QAETVVFQTATKPARNPLELMLERTLYIILIFSFKLSFGQFSDSLILQCYNQEVYDFNFFQKNKIQQVDHYVQNGANAKDKYLEYSLIYNKENNTITKRLRTGSEDLYKEGVYGHPIICLDRNDDSSCIDNQKYNSKGKIVIDGNHTIKYDSLDRMTYIIDTTQNKSNYYREILFNYNSDKLASRIELMYYKTALKDKLIYNYYYKSSTNFGYNITYPDNWVKSITKKEYIINEHQLEIISYLNDNIVSKEIDIIVKKH
ncbi:MAG TPA: hypothetical protein PKZ75_04605, partial [Bacteroidia bacterium]|nr:hypothetical protein [Bacteroidia bacterium]